MKFDIVTQSWNGSTRKVARKIEAQDHHHALGQFLEERLGLTHYGDQEAVSDCGCVRLIEYIAPDRESLIPGLYWRRFISEVDVRIEEPCERHEMEVDRGIEGRFEARRS